MLHKCPTLFKQTLQNNVNLNKMSILLRCLWFDLFQLTSTGLERRAGEPDSGGRRKNRRRKQLGQPAIRWTVAHFFSTRTV